MTASSGGPRRASRNGPFAGKPANGLRAGRVGLRRTAAELRENMRDRLIESRLTPNSISMTGLVLNVVAAVLVTQRLFFLAGVAFIVGSLMDTLDGRYSRMSGKGTLFGAFLDSTLDRMEEGIVLTAVAAYFASRGDELAVAATVVVRARIADGELHARPRRGARRRVQGRIGDPPGAGSTARRAACSSPRAPGSATSSCWRRRST